VSSYCPNCGAQNIAGGQFCASCGGRLPQAQAQAAATVGAGAPAPSAPGSPADAGSPPENPSQPISSTATTNDGFTSFIPPARRAQADEQIRRFRQLNPHDLIAAARPVLLVLLGSLVVSVALAAVLGVTIGSNGHHGSPADWARAGALLLCTAVRAPLVLSLQEYDSYDDSSLISELTLTAAPLLLTAILAFVLHRIARRTERAAGETDVARMAAQALCAALAFGLGTCVVALLSSGALDFGLGDDSDVAGIDVSASAGRALIGAFLIALLATVSGQLAETGLPFRETGGLRLARNLFGFLLATASVIGTVVVIWRSIAEDGLDLSGLLDIDLDEVSGAVTSLAILVLAAANLVLAGTGMLLGGTLTVHASGDGTSIRWTESVGLFAGHLDWGWYLTPLAVLLVALLLGARSALHRDPHRAAQADLWPALATFIAIWVVALWVSRVSVRYTEGDDAGTAFIGLGTASTLLSACFWIFVSVMLGTAVAQILAGVRPRWAYALGGAGTDEDWELILAHHIQEHGGQMPQGLLEAAAALDAGQTPPQPPERMHRRRDRVLAMVGTSAVLAAIALFAGYRLVAAQFFTPEAVIQDWYDALGDRDASAAIALLKTPPLKSEQTLMVDAVITSIPRPSGIKQSWNEDGSAGVNAEFDDDAYDTTWTLHRSGHRLGIFPRWKIDASPALLTVDRNQGSSSSALTINGVKVETGVYPVFPGKYEAKLAAGGPWGATSDSTTTNGTEDSSVSLSADIASGAREAASQAVNQYLDDCAEAATTLDDTDCPFDSYSYYDQVSDVKWSITEYPDVEVTVDSSGQLAVSSDYDAGTAHVEATGIWLDDVDKISDDDAFSVQGTVDWDGSGSTATFSPDSSDF
jgi:hypothetical protein